MKSGDVIHSGASCASVRGSGWAIRKCAIEPDGAMDDRLEKRDTLARGDSEMGSVSMAIVTSCSSLPFGRSSSGAGRMSVPSDNCLNIRFTAIMPAAPVNAARSAPTYPGVAFARAIKSKSPSKRSLAQRTRSILCPYKNDCHFLQQGKHILCSCLIVRDTHANFVIESASTT